MMDNMGGIKKEFGFVFWLLLAMSLLSATVGGYYTWHEYQTLGWKKVNAKIVEGGYFNPNYRDTDEIIVEYVLDGKNYRHSSPYTYAQSLVLTEDLSTMRKYAYGATVELFYDPIEKPEMNSAAGSNLQRHRTVLKQGLSNDFYVPFIFAGIFFVGAFGLRRLYGVLVRGGEKVVKKVAKLAELEHCSFSAKEIIQDDTIDDLTEDKQGRVMFNNTMWAGRIFTTLFFMGIFAIFYWVFITWMGATHAEMQFYVVIVLIYGLVAAFTVSDTTIIKREGVIYTRRGWLFFVRKKKYMLYTFNKVVVKEHDPDKFISVHRRRATRQKTYSINLDGKEQVSIYVAGRFDGACKLARQVAKYLRYDVEY